MFNSRFIISVCSMTAVMLQAVALQAEEIPFAKPAQVGFSAEKLAGVDQAMEKLLAAKKLAGGIVLVARHGKIAHFKAYGLADMEAKRAMKIDDIVRIYSMTKAVASTAAMILVDEGKLGLDDAVSKHIPEFKNLEVFSKDGNKKPKREMTVRDLMRHTSGLTYGYFGDTEVDKTYLRVDVLGRRTSLKEMAEKLGKIPLLFDPGQDWLYGVSTDVLGRVVEVVAKQPFGEFMQERILKPLDMKDTAFHVSQDKLDRFVPNYTTSFGFRRVDGIATSQFVQKPGLYSGGGGLMSTARDYLRFLQMIANGGELFGKRIVSKEAVRLMSTNQLPKDVKWIKFGENERTGVGYGLGFSVRVQKSNFDPDARLGEFGWGGAASTHYWVSPKDNLIVITLEQTMPYSFSTEFAVKPIIYGAIE
jgi:CubicO group peptidase (beta-lactamase class C family)